VGEWDTACYGKGVGTDIQMLKELRYPHSLGLLYNAITYYLGFKVNSDEYKVMGLAPYGEPCFIDQMRQLMAVQPDGSLKLNLEYFAFPYGLRMTNKKFDELFGGPPREPETGLEQKHKDIAASVQAITEEVVLKMAHHLYRETGLTNLCLAGGVALNCVANGRLLKEGPFENIFIQPAAGDAGAALGVAGFAYHTLLKNNRNFKMRHPYWGPEFPNREIKMFLENEAIPFKEFDSDKLVELTAGYIAEDKIIGWFQGRMEFGPRALGNRSILANPKNPAMKDIINQKIKFREDFRPFAPAVLEGKVNDYFQIDCPSPFMLLVAQVKPEKQNEIPSVTHVDGSARVQTVNQEDNPLFYDLLNAFDKLTGCPVIINTSFNVRGEPIVCNPREAYNCFMKTGMDYLVMGNYVVAKK
jgi:carbamoyltransferase